MIRPMTTMTASAIRTHPSGVIFARPVGELVGEGAADVASAVGEGEGDGDGDGDGGAVVTSGVGAADVGRLGGEMVTSALAAALLSALPALLTAAQPVIKNAAAKNAAARIAKPLQRPFDITVILGPAGSGVFTRRG